MTWVCLAACLLSFGCRIRSTGPRWIETHGRGELTRVAGGPVGLLAIGTNGLVYRYPGPGGTWQEWGLDIRPRAIAGTRDGLLYSDQEHRVGTGRPGRRDAPAWTLASDVTELVSDEAGNQAYAIADGKVSRLLGSGQVVELCPEVHAVAIAVAQGQLWLSDAEILYVAADDKCTRAGGAPEGVTRLSGLKDRLYAVDDSGDIFRREKSGTWQKLPLLRKFRPDRMPHDHPATDVAVTSTATWALDDERTVFVLSESE